MTKEQAWEILKQVSQVVKGTLAEHQAIHQALELLKPEAKKDEVKTA